MNRYLLLFALTLCATLLQAQVTEIPEANIAELGTTAGTPQMSGFIFIDGRYLPPPYTVTRRGNGIFINRILAEIPLPWPRGATGAPALKAGDALDADGDFEVIAPLQQAPQQAAPATTAPKVIQSIDDLFGDDDDTPTPTPPPPPTQTPAPTEKLLAQPPAALPQEREQTIEALDRTRQSYEQAIAKGEIFLFGKRHNRVNGTYGSARTLLGVLPRALRYATSAQDLQMRLQQGGIHFLDITICHELYKNKTTFPLLEERLKRIEASEAIEAAKRQQQRRW